MRRTVFALVLALVLALAALPAAGAAAPERAPLHRATGEAVEDSYIVVLEDGRDPAAVAAQVGARPEHVYGAALRGFAAELDARALERVRRHPHVAFVEEDQVATASNQQNPPSWGLDRIDQQLLPLDQWYFFNTTAQRVNVYVVDTGIEYSHWDFGGRAVFGYDAFGGTGNDCHGHGTHVAGTAGGTSYGVAKQAALWAVRVLDCTGSGTYSGVIAGINWVAANHSPPAVATVSLGGGYSASLNSAVDSLYNSGVLVAVAAGNASADACNYSPSGATNAYTVAASTIADARAAFSNFGPCVNVYAPGVSITSDWIGGGSATYAGTSMAAAHVAGVGALYLSYFPSASPGAVASWITTNATPGVISGNPPGTPNLLLYKSTL